MIEAKGPSGMNFIPVGCLLEAMEQAPSHEQATIAIMLRKMDFADGNVMH